MNKMKEPLYDEESIKVDVSDFKRLPPSERAKAEMSKVFGEIRKLSDKFKNLPDLYIRRMPLDISLENFYIEVIATSFIADARNKPHRIERACDVCGTINFYKNLSQKGRCPPCQDRVDEWVEKHGVTKLSLERTRAERRGRLEKKKVDLRRELEGLTFDERAELMRSVSAKHKRFIAKALEEL